MSRTQTMPIPHPPAPRIAWRGAWQCLLRAVPRAAPHCPSAPEIAALPQHMLRDIGLVRHAPPVVSAWGHSATMWRP